MIGAPWTDETAVTNAIATKIEATFVLLRIVSPICERRRSGGWKSSISLDLVREFPADFNWKQRS